MMEPIWKLVVRTLKTPMNDWFASVESDALTVVGSVRDVAQSNMWSFSLAEEERADIKRSDAVAFVQAVFSLWRQRLGAVREAWWMYCWHDAMASQLRLSTCPVSELGELPFGRALSKSDLEPICEDWLSEPTVVPWSELEEPAGPVDPNVVPSLLPLRIYCFEVVPPTD
jgi:hypothetical protein